MRSADTFLCAQLHSSCSAYMQFVRSLVWQVQSVSRNSGSDRIVTNLYRALSVCLFVLYGTSQSGNVFNLMIIKVVVGGGSLITILQSLGNRNQLIRRMNVFWTEVSQYNGALCCKIYFVSQYKPKYKSTPEQLTPTLTMKIFSWLFPLKPMS